MYFPDACLASLGAHVAVMTAVAGHAIMDAAVLGSHYIHDHSRASVAGHIDAQLEWCRLRVLAIYVVNCERAPGEGGVLRYIKRASEDQ